MPTPHVKPLRLTNHAAPGKTNHHLRNNLRTWWCHSTVRHKTTNSKRRCRSLETRILEDAHEARDRLQLSPIKASINAMKQSSLPRAQDRGIPAFSDQRPAVKPTTENQKT
jgi:hypothetical protein